MSHAAIFGCKGLSLSAEERSFFKSADPWGFILFARNIESPDQIRALCAELRESVGRDAPILIDQEGGRVARLRAPLARDWLPPLDQCDALSTEHRREAMVLRYRIIAHELRALGIDVNCAPMLDVATPNSHDIILNRCYGRDPDQVAEMGRAVSEGLLAGGVLPIIKHIPGHGRADLDSHLDLPVIDTDFAELCETDFLPFQRLADLPMAMTAHIVFQSIDPKNCITHSKRGVEVIRNEIGFDGLLMTDDLSMEALSGNMAARTQAAIDAGCDVILHCNGQRSEMDAILSNTPVLDGVAQLRADKALAMRQSPDPFDLDTAMARFERLF